jgi:hypothetical protein
MRKDYSVPQPSQWPSSNYLKRPLSGVVFCYTLIMSRSLFLKCLFITTIANFVAQIPYYFHQYYLATRSAPSILGLVLMTVVLGWFLAGCYLLAQRKNIGYLLTVSFLIIEFLFYLQTQIMQYLSGRGVFLYVLHPDDWLLFLVFGIGYINFFASAWFIIHLLKRKSEYVSISRSRT